MKHFVIEVRSVEHAPILSALYIFACFLECVVEGPKLNYLATVYTLQSLLAFTIKYGLLSYWFLGNSAGVTRKVARFTLCITEYISLEKT